MDGNKTGGFLPRSTIECIRSWLRWQTTLETMSGWRKMVPRGLIARGLPVTWEGLLSMPGSTKWCLRVKLVPNPRSGGLGWRGVGGVAWGS